MFPTRRRLGPVADFQSVIGGGDEQDETDRAPYAMQGRSNPPDRRFKSRFDPDAPFAASRIVFRMLLHHLPGQGVHRGLRLVTAYARLQERNHRQVFPATVHPLLRRQRQWDPDCVVLLYDWWDDADHGVGAAVQLDSSAGDVRVCAESLLPEFMTDQRNIVFPRLFLLGEKRPAQFRIDSYSLKV